MFVKTDLSNNTIKLSYSIASDHFNIEIEHNIYQLLVAPKAVEESVSATFSESSQ
jgi:hypothetical protein